MCEGRLSSGIRKNRDNLPPLPQIFDDTFVEQVKEYIPHLEELRFNGGEPFAQQIVYDICMIVAETNPSLRINIATNGTVYNKRVKEILEKCNVHLNISIDSLVKERYESIRINGVFEELMQNFEKFKTYCHENNRGLSVMVNPMRSNWMEMPNFVNFANDNNVWLWFNTIHHPKDLSIWSLPSDELKVIYDTLLPISEDMKPVTNDDSESWKKLGNWQKLDHFVNKQVLNWHKKQVDREANQ
jgi:MoaA/NifB/PqqE/SkfB family radical SAM enzyme